MFDIAVGSLFDHNCIFFAGPSASQMALEVQERAADEPDVESVRTRKWSAAFAGSNDMCVRVVLFWGVALDFDGFSSS